MDTDFHRCSYLRFLCDHLWHGWCCYTCHPFLVGALFPDKLDEFLRVQNAGVVAGIPMGSIRIISKTI